MELSIWWKARAQEKAIETPALADVSLVLLTTLSTGVLARECDQTKVNRKERGGRRANSVAAVQFRSRDDRHLLFGANYRRRRENGKDILM